MASKWPKYIPVTNTAQFREGRIPYSGKQRFIGKATELMYAAQQGDVHKVKKILKDQPWLVIDRDRTRKTALHYCATSGHICAAQVADFIVMAAPDLVDSRDEDGFTPLHLAVISGNMQLVTFLIANNADIMAVDNERHTVVHWATVCGETTALRAVLAAGAPISTPDIHGGYPLHYAAQMCGGDRDSHLGLEVLQTLLIEPNIQVSVTDEDKRQPLLWAASAGSAKAVLALVKAGAIVEAADKDGLTALHCAASRGHTDCLDSLLTLCGASADIIDCNGCTALHYAVTLGHADATALLLAHGADPNRQDRKGRSPAHCGCAKGQFETIKLLGSSNANLWLKNARGDLPLHDAAASGRRNLVKWLLQMRPSQINARNNDGRCPLHMAALNDNADMCKVLIDAGAQINPILRTSKNVFMTPLDCALQKGFRSTAKFLQLHGGMPAVRLADPHNQIASVQLKHDVTNWGDISSESEVEGKEIQRLRKSYRKKISQKENRTDLTVSKSEKQIQTHSSLSYGNGELLSNEILDMPIQEVTQLSKVDRTITSERNDMGQSQETSQLTINHVNDTHGEGYNILNNALGKEIIQEREKRPRSAKYSKFKGDKELSISEQESDSHTEYRTTQLKGDGVKDTSALSMEVDVIMNENSSSYQQINHEEKLGMDDIDLNIINVVTTDSFTKDEMMRTNERTDLLVEASVHPLPPKFTMENEQIISDSNRNENGTKREDEQDETGVDTNNCRQANSKFKTNFELETPKEIQQSYEISERKTDTNIPVGIPESPSSQNEKEIEDVEGVIDKEIDEIVGFESHSPMTCKGNIDDDHDKSECHDNKSQTQEIPEENEESAQSNKEIELVHSTVNVNTNESGNEILTNEESSVSYDTEKEEKMVKDEKDVLTSSDENITENAPTTERIGEFNGATDKTHKSFRVLKEEEFEKIKKRTLKRPRKKAITKKSRSHSDETKESNRNLKQRRMPDKIPNPMFQNKLSKSDKYLDKAYDSNTPESKLDKRISSLPNIPYDKRILKENVRCESNMSAPLLYSDNERDSLTDPEDFHRKISKNKRFVKKKSRNRVARSAGSDYESSNLIDSGFEPSPRTTKIPRWKNMSERGVNMTSVTQNIQSNIRRYHLERKIFYNLLELKRHQIRAGQHNEAILVKRAIDDYHKSCVSTVGAGRYIPQDFTFKSFEKFLYEALRKLQKNGPDYIKGLPEPPSNPLLCTRSTNRCMHATHAYTGVPCAAYLPKMDHHSIPKIGFNNTECKPTSGFLPIIQKKGVTVELTQGSEKQIISLPTDRLDQNKRYYVTFTVRGHELPDPKKNTNNQESQAPHRHARSH